MRLRNTAAIMILLFLSISACRNSNPETDKLDAESEIRDAENVPDEVEEKTDTDPDNTRVEELDADELLPEDTSRVQ